MKFSLLISFITLCLSFCLGQSLKNRLLVPIYVHPSVSFGYDSNFLKLSDSEIGQATLGSDVLGDATTYDSNVIRPQIKLFYSPVLFNRYETEFLFTFSHSKYGQLKEKSYSRYSFVYGHHLGPYNWLKIGYANLPKYFIRNYNDRDLSDNFRYRCSFSSEEFFISYSFPVWEMTWLRFRVKGINEFYNSHFTEFDQQKLMGQIEFHSGISKWTKYSVSISHGNSINTTHDLGLISTDIDRSYLMDKLILSFTHYPQFFSTIEKVGLSLSAEQKLYELGLVGDSIDDWKYYFESNVFIWSQIQIHNDIDLKVSYKYRNRKADSNPFGEFSWVEEVKDFSKHLVWVEFSYDLAVDLFY